MALQRIGEYNTDQLASFRALTEAMHRLDEAELHGLRQAILPYLDFRRNLDRFSSACFGSYCGRTCFETCMSACCGFESIFTFFADQVVTCLESEPADMDALFRVLARPNTSKNCVYLGQNGCLWRVRPISCAMFFCDQAKEAVFGEQPKAKSTWEVLRAREKEFTWPTQPVLFDELEVFFRNKGLDSPHMYFHRSPGLLRLKKQAGLPM